MSIAAILNVALGEVRVFMDEIGREVTLRFNPTAISGLSVSSLRPFLNGLNVAIGDYLTLILDGHSNSFEIGVTLDHEATEGLGTVGRLIGLPEPVSAATIAAVFRCEMPEIRNVLVMRGESELLEYWPVCNK